MLPYPLNIYIYIYLKFEKAFSELKKEKEV